MTTHETLPFAPPARAATLDASPEDGAPAARARAVRQVVAFAEERRTALLRRRCDVVALVAAVAARTLDERGLRLRARAAEVLRAYDAVGFAPPLFRMAGRAEAEKPYNRLLGWLLTPSSDHGIALAALKLLARRIEHAALAADLEDAGCAARLEVRSEARWPEDVRSRKAPDLLVVTDRALLLIESKLWSPESGDQYGPYKRSLDELAAARGIPSDAARAHLLAPTLRDEPQGWGRSLEFTEIAGCFAELATDGALSSWDRAVCAMAAQTFARDDVLADRVAAGRTAVDEAARGPMTAALLRRLSEAAALPLPFNPWRDPT